MEYFRYILDRRTFKLINNGVFCVNKVKNASTSNVISSIKSILARDILQLHPEVEDDVNMFLKVGHGGILEDSASGVLVVGVSSGCKVLSNVSNRNKHYRVTGCLGNATDTFTNAGNITLSASYGKKRFFLLFICPFEYKLTKLNLLYWFSIKTKRVLIYTT
ncbi:probable tRNA pseudouridine synthase 1 [Diaphorina citri]|uniref:tRNA pseudouridine(55) synthase n=1 Tax=Diaphorina citri TaxID=121845 RepID=A0A3Q0J6V5_DIACI|nr:probable tRNA pseudouridine synthase 1 [Diaphorina citri]